MKKNPFFATKNFKHYTCCRAYGPRPGDEFLPEQTKPRAKGTGKFREAGIHGGPETREAIIAAGFDPEKLRSLNPPENQDNQ